MKISLIICTYMRPEAVSTLLASVAVQTRYPDEILIIDGSTDEMTKDTLSRKRIHNLSYIAVPPSERGLTKQRNFGIQKAATDTDVIAFLDDDTILDSRYFEALEIAFEEHPNAIGIGGVATNENRWELADPTRTYTENEYYRFENYVVKESSRNVLRNKLGLASPEVPGVMPDFSNGRTFSYPLTGKIYPVDLLIGMSMAFRASVFTHIKFSEYFIGYGLYEDADFSLRALKYGQNFLATSVQLEHHHAAGGRPNMYKYGKMVLRNGWYVWRLKFPNPTLKARLKWHSTAGLLTLVRLTNVATGPKRKEALRETLGRVVGWWSLLFNKPKHQ